MSLPEVPLLGVLPGTGGLTRLVDKRHVRRDLADVFATRAEGARAPRRSLGLVDVWHRRALRRAGTGAGAGPASPHPTDPPHRPCHAPPVLL